MNGSRALGALLGWLAGSVLRIRRTHVEQSMRAAGIDAPEREARAFYAELGLSAIEFLRLALRGPRALSHVEIDEPSRARWRDALARNHGVVVAASHTGNWDLAACAVAREVELLVVTKHLSVRWLDRFWQSTRAALGVRLADAAGAMARARETLRRGGAVAMMIDQAPSRAQNAVSVEFLGRTAHADRAAAALAASAGAPLVVAASRRDELGRQIVEVLDVLLPPRRAGRAWIERATREATRALDAFVRRHPSQWLWLHRRWKPMLASPCRTTPSSSPAGASTAA
ncbi:MAG TPA: lysophospholipid acyltransferase family protein [Polyangiaceae bacterium]|nr:lysophospholipid acyltransferase family protein [Polyangiaceae bacterium]